MSKSIRDELKKQVLAQIDGVVGSRNQFQSRVSRNGPEDDDSFHTEHIISSARLAIERVCPPGSTLIKQMETVLAGSDNDYVKADKITAIAATLKGALENDHLVQFEELIHGELFSDFLDMAEHLLAEGYKDAAAVIAGGSLESHLRQLCIKYGIAITITKHGATNSKTASPMNDNLVGAKVYPPTQYKLISAFIGFRNDAAHGDYGKYTDGDIQTMIMGIRVFQGNYPA
jgi:hypothetical protein